MTRVIQAVYARADGADTLKPYGLYNIDIIVLSDNKCVVHARKTNYIEIFDTIKDVFESWHIKPLSPAEILRELI